ncbi:hypothetical protein KAU45_07790 [bacterium]|nr:hypothetical protein [bacterium]
MNKRLPVFLVLLAVLPVLANLSVYTDTQNPLAQQIPHRTDWIYVPEVIVTGALMFLAGAHTNHVDTNGYDYYANDQGLKLVYNCMTYLLDRDWSDEPIGCIGDFGKWSGLQTGYDAMPDWDQNYMQFLESNLNNEGCNFTLEQISNSDPLIGDGEILYDIVMIGDRWNFNVLHSRAEYSAYVSLGGKIIIAGTWDPIPDPAGGQLDFLPKNRIWMKRDLYTEFLLPATDPSHPIAENIINPQWWYRNYELWDGTPWEGPVNPEIYNRIFKYDDEYYTKIFADPPGFPDTPSTLVLGGQWKEIPNAVHEMSWGAIKAQF